MAFLPIATAENGPNWLNHTLPKLHSTTALKLCEVINNRPILLVNTASYCGFTHQFESLQQLHERYHSQGLVIIGFPSNDFRQEAKDESNAFSIAVRALPFDCVYIREISNASFLSVPDDGFFLFMT